MTVRKYPLPSYCVGVKHIQSFEIKNERIPKCYN